MRRLHGKGRVGFGAALSVTAMLAAGVAAGISSEGDTPSVAVIDRGGAVEPAPDILASIEEAGVRLQGARMAQEDGERAILVSVGASQAVCLTFASKAGGAVQVGHTCNPRSVLATWGAIPAVTRDPSGALRFIAVIPDGFDTVALPGRGVHAVLNNTVSVPIAADTEEAVLTGESGTRRLPVGQLIPRS